MPEGELPDYFIGLLRAARVRAITEVGEPVDQL
jgi:hypothetical protein